jgi:uncharacterized protein (UPF0276 family)
MKQALSFGLGLDMKYMDRYNNSIHAALRNQQTPLSHLSIVGISQPQEAQEFLALAADRPVIHHLSGISPCSIQGPDLQRLSQQESFSKSMQVPWCCEDIGLWSIGSYDLPYFAPPLFTEEVAHFVAQGIRAMQDMISVPFLAEVPSVSCIIGELSLADFFRILVEESGCGIVLDISHVYSVARASQSTWQEVLEGFPAHRVREIHIAGGRLNDKHPDRYIDSHSDYILDEVYEILDQAIAQIPGIEAVTYEVGAALDDEKFLYDFARLSERLKKHHYSPGILQYGRRN